MPITIRLGLVAALIGSLLVVGGPAGAHGGADVTPNKAGPIRRGETTMSELRDWFGDPTATTVVEVGCVRVDKVRWGRRLTVYVSRDGSRTVAAIFVTKRTITSSEHGELALHTTRGLRVGDRERRVRNLYPHSEPITHSGHTHYRLDTNRSGEYVMAKVVDHRVVRLEVWPYEFC